MSNTNVILIDGVFGSEVAGLWGMYLDNPYNNISLQVLGGTYYFDPTKYLDADQYKATKTQDADNVDIWVVTEK